MQDNRTEIETPQLVDEVLPDSSPEGGHERRLARYAVAKTRQGLVSDFIIKRNADSEKKTLEKEAKSLQDCGSFLVFRHYLTLGLYKMIQGCTCKKHLLCALCAIRRAAKCIAIYSEKINQVKAESKTEFDEVMITFTIKNGDNLSERYDHLLRSMTRMLQKRRDSLKKNALTDTELKHVAGAVYSYEVTYSAEKGFHPHCHMIALIPKGVFTFTPIKIKEKIVEVPLVLKRGIVEDWHQITSDSFIVDVRRITDTEMPQPGESISGTRLEALVEVFKYALKMNQISKDSEVDSQENIRIQVEAYEVLKGRRMIGSFGALFGVKIPDSFNDQPLTAEELPYVDLVYQYSGVNFGYQMVSHGDVRTDPKVNGDHLKKKILDKLMKGFKASDKWRPEVDSYDAKNKEVIIFKDGNMVSVIGKTPGEVLF